MSQSSNTRQTRSQTKAVQEARANLKSPELTEQQANKRASDFYLVASRVEVEEGEEHVCGGCDRRYSAEGYMIQCSKCAHLYHVKCAMRNCASGKSKLYLCTQCSPLDTTIPPSSVNSRSSARSSRQTRLTRELERLEEERELELQIDRARLEQLERSRQYLAKKNELLKQQEENEEAISVRSRRGSRGTSRSRTEEWVEKQAKVNDNAGPEDAGKTSKSVDPGVDTVHSLIGNPVETLGDNFTSTPMKRVETVEQVTTTELFIASAQDGCHPVQQMESVTAQEIQNNAGVGIGNQLISPRIPSVNVQPLISLLEESNPGTRTGSFPKCVRTLPNYDLWRSQTGDLRKKKLEQKLELQQKELEMQNKRELDMAYKLKTLETQREEESNLQRQREAELKKQLQLRDHEQAQLKLQRERELADRDKELKDLREMQHQLTNQLELLLQRDQQRAAEPRKHVRLEEESQIPEQEKHRQLLQGGTLCGQVDVVNRQHMVSGAQETHKPRPEQPEVDKPYAQRSFQSGVRDSGDPWFISEIEKVYHSRRENARVSQAGQFSSIGLNPSRLSIPPVNEQFQVPPSLLLNASSTNDNYSHWEQYDTPEGRRTQDQSTVVSHMIAPHGVPPIKSQWPQHVSHVQTPPMASSIIPVAQLGPTQQQLAARQVVSKELPFFSGDSVDWPLFISSYQHSTQVCGYSDSENLLRLQRALKGAAKEAVSSFLLHPSMVDQVLSTLQLLYGRPEQIVHNMIAKVRGTPSPRADRLDTLVSFGLVVQNLCGHLKAVGLEKHLSNPTLLQELVDKLPANVKFNWALYQEQLTDVDLNAFGVYMAKIASATSSITLLSGSAQRASRDDRPKAKERAFVNAHAATDQSEPRSRGTSQSSERQEKINLHQANTFKKTEPNLHCPACNIDGHHAVGCLIFKRLPLDSRWNVVKEHKLCRRCLTSHARWPCKGEVCGVNGCQKRHHRLLHYDPPESKLAEQTTNATVTIHRQLTSPTLFRVLPVTLYGNKGRVETYAFLDDGSSVTLVEQTIADALGLDGHSESLCIHWTSGIKRQVYDTKRVALDISGASSNKKFNITDVYTVDNLGLPEQSMDFSEMEKQFQHLRKLPVQSFINAVPGILIGLSNVHLMTTLNLREGRVHEPVAMKTRIGWVVCGSLREGKVAFKHRQMHICSTTPDQELHDYVRGFFNVESLGVALVPEVDGAENQRANNILADTTLRTEGGRFQTGLLWKYDYIEFPDSKPMAEKRLKCLEQRLMRKPELYENIRQQISEYQRKGYAHKATLKELEQFDPRRTWYLPLGVVQNPKKPGKIRLIWDAAAKVDGVSLNTMLLKGPDLLTSLLSVLFKYRERQVAICADIQEMFHQILIRPEDRSSQLFLWRNSPDHPMDTMVTDVAIFGASCSPAHSQYIKNKNATEHQIEYPKAADAIKGKHYVDDYLDSVDTVQEAVERALQVAKVHDRAGFHIRNWMSNDRTVLERIGEANPTTVKCFSVDKESGLERLLGMVWMPEEDAFTFSLNFRDDMGKLMKAAVVPSKREMLRVVMSIYDPLGLVAAFVIHGKVLIQDVWRANIGWDDKIPCDVFNRWKQWLLVLQKIENIKIPRCYFPGYDPDSFKTIELHIFVDASEEAFAAVAYLRIVDRRTVRCTLVASKTKVAPLQPLSIPRLELLAAVLGARLRKTIEEEHSLKIVRTIFWCDSTTVLAWIKSDLRRYRQYVAVRVNEILALSTVKEWRWVPTRLNVADEATKWGKGPSFETNNRWYRGPEFLYDEESEWPKDCRTGNVAVETAEELRPAFVFKHFAVQPIVQLDRFSKWERLLRCLAYVHHFIGKQKLMPEQKRDEFEGLTKEELQKAERSLWLLAQSEAYPDEISTMRRNLHVSAINQKHLEQSSQILNLTPCMDEYGVLRVGSRADAAECIDYNAKYPVILPKGHRVTDLLVDWYHRKYHHANDATVVNEMRQKFHISTLRVQVRLAAKRCMWCRVYKARPAVPKMGPLPKVRLTPFLRPFTFTGIDYFGPYMIKVHRSSVKRWVALFTCLTVRAIHLEIVASLSSDSCKKAVRRFIARRGSPQEFYTDNGTNFGGANRELAEEKKKIGRELSSTFTDVNTQWRFNPPSAPHMGGCWERMVRSVKTALSSIPEEQKLDEESLVTFLAEAENMVNSRPLTFVTLETTADESLSPNHFLMLSSDGVRQPVKDPVDEKTALRDSWCMIQHTLDKFWHRWIVEYLPTITRRTKWFHDVRPIKEGELVIIVDEKTRNRWLRGRVLRTYPGRDGIVRKADVQVQGGVLQRPIAKLALLDVDAEDDAEVDLQTTRGGECSVQVRPKDALVPI